MLQWDQLEHSPLENFDRPIEQQTDMGCQREVTVPKREEEGKLNTKYTSYRNNFLNPPCNQSTLLVPVNCRVREVPSGCPSVVHLIELWDNQ